MTGCTATRHGTRGAYVSAGCRCPEARAANARYAYERHRRTAKAAHGMADPFTVPVDQAQDVLARLKDAGWTHRQISLASGVKRDRLSRINGNTSRPVTRVHHSTYAKLARLLEQPAPIPPSALVDGTGTRRRLEALVALGYPKTYLAQLLDVGRALQITAARVTKRNADKVTALYDQLQHTPGPSDRARAYAAARGWLHPGWWDDDTIDDPTHQPDTTETRHRRDEVDPVAVDLACAGQDIGRPLTRAERITAVLRLTEDERLSQPAAAARLGIHQRQVVRDLADYGPRQQAAS